eukprot:TRINITY_DN1958_c0_g2_i1.p1 TRINITY_DN1958_c0_g2~~TRINITY_DN1958_c0_g2_i1.p1  ORF type:complete len:124 (+),score=7.78 TRINITY_DN1958_c0_g2_i1:40-411(+)
MVQAQCPDWLSCLACRMALLDIPTDVIYIILGFGDVRLAGRVARLCRKGNHVVKNAPIWVQFALRDKETLLNKKRDRSFDYNAIHREAAITSVDESISFLKRRAEDNIWNQGRCFSILAPSRH